MDNLRITHLYRLYLSQSLSPLDLEEFSALLSDNDQISLLNDSIDMDWEKLGRETLLENPANQSDAAFNYIISHPQNLYRKRNIWKRIAIAASFILVAGISFYFYNTEISSQQNTKWVNDVTAGRQSATLTLADGRKIVLADAKNGELAKQSGVLVSKMADGKISYTITGGGEETDQVNTLATANGETFQVVLPDGSIVNLNATSSLKYPASFAARKQRVVELTGEAYFEVAKDKRHPFVVMAEKQRVTVLGTHFNINSYRDEQVIKTTLFEGSVRINDAMTLKPGNAVYNDGNKLTVRKADVEADLAWKNGDFLFRGESLESVMRKVARWYNVEVKYEAVAKKDFPLYGYVSRKRNLGSVLDILKRTKNLNFRIEGRTVTVTD